MAGLASLIDHTRSQASSAESRPDSPAAAKPRHRDTTDQWLRFGKWGIAFTSSRHLLTFPYMGQNHDDLQPSLPPSGVPLISFCFFIFFFLVMKSPWLVSYPLTYPEAKPKIDPYMQMSENLGTIYQESSPIDFLAVDFPPRPCQNPGVNLSEFFLAHPNSESISNLATNAVSRKCSSRG